MTTRKANATKARKAHRASLAKAITGAASLGYGVAGGFQAAVSGLKGFTLQDRDKAALADFGLQYKAGYMVRYAEANMPSYAKRVGNQPLPIRVDGMLEVYGKPYPQSAKPNRRTEAEHKMCRAADVSWNAVRARAGLAKPKAPRKPRTTVVAPEPPRDLITSCPKLADKAAANDHFATAAAALLATVNGNARKVVPQISSAVQDLYTVMVDLGLIKPAKPAKR